MTPMLPSSTSWFSRALALALLVLPTAAQAQSLPKGYASDESPSSAPAKAATVTTPAEAPAMKATAGDDTSATATAQISTATDEYADTDASALTDFQEPLQGYGSWVNDDTYGTVWIPDTAQVGSDFAPYQTGGYWTLTDDDQWLWVSTYDWGYVPFHYGRWLWISGRGWAWIPGRTYAPSWVVWRTSDYGYLGWAPMPPEWYWYGGSAVYFTTVPAAAYVFCPTTYVFNTHVTNYVVHDKDTITRVAAHSRSYKPASPTTTTASSDHKSAGSASASSTSSGSILGSAGAKGTASASKKPVGPSMKEAGVPESAMPAKRTAVDARASLYSKKSTTAKAKAMVKAQRTALASAVGSQPGSRAGLTQPGTRAPSSSGIHSPSQPIASAPRSSQPVSAATPRPSQPISMSRTSQPVTASTPRPSQPVSMPRTSQPVSVSAPRPSQPVSVPRVSQPVSRPSAPVSRPSVSAPRVSAPVSRPSVSAPRVSTPHVGGGGAHFGGGHRR